VSTKFPAVCNGVDLNSDVLAQLAQHPNIVGVKLTCGNAGKVTRLTQEFSHDQFGVYGGSSDWLIPCLIGGGQGCVTGVGNVFPKSVTRLYALWTEGKVKEAVQLQGLVAQAEKACKEGIAPTKFGAAYYAGPRAGVLEKEKFWPRRPYLPSDEKMQKWVIDVMSELNVIEASLPDLRGHGNGVAEKIIPAKTNGVSAVSI
jgi:dihydrodipicolinate synthase/N-acetylneuraminate lyase